VLLSIPRKTALEEQAARPLSGGPSGRLAAAHKPAAMTDAAVACAKASGADASRSPSEGPPRSRGGNT